MAETETETKKGREIEIPISIIDRHLSMADEIEDDREFDRNMPRTDDEVVEAMNMLSDMIGIALETVDETAKKSGYPGLGKVPADKYSELVTIVIKKNLSENMIRFSPELALTAVTAGVIGNNFLEYQKKKKKIENSDKSDK